MDLPSAVSNVDSTLTRVTQTPSEIRSDRLLVAYSTRPKNMLPLFRGEVEMSEALLQDYPELRPFVLSDVQFTGTRIGGGAYGRVDEVAIPVSAAAKTIYAFLQESDGSRPDDEVPKAVTELVRECQLMSTPSATRTLSSSLECAFCKARDCRRSSWSDC